MEGVAEARVGEGTSVEVVIAIKQSEQGRRKLHDEFFKRSDPENEEDFGKWFSRREIDEMIAPDAASVAAVSAHIERNAPGSKVIFNGARDWLSVTVTAAEYERLFSRPLTRFIHSETNTTAVRTALPRSFPHRSRIT